MFQSTPPTFLKSFSKDFLSPVALTYQLCGTVLREAFTKGKKVGDQAERQFLSRCIGLAFFCAFYAYLQASFVNWECSLTCDKFDEDQCKFGVWVDIPPGRYEFCFVVDGQWTTCDQYPTVTNEFGSRNNWRYIN